MADGWQKITQLYKGKKLYWYRSPQILSLKLALQRVIAKYAKGIILDAGAGSSVYKYMFSKYKYFAVDTHSDEGLDCLANIEHLPFRQNKFDTIFCSQVLEHLSTPCNALSEFYRVLKPDGTLILTVPHLSCYHELPNDYYRFTAQGISFLLKKTGFRIIQIKPCGSLLCFIGHIFSRIILGYAGEYTLLRNLLLVINGILSYLIVFTDSLLSGFTNVAPLNIIVISTK